MLNIATHGDETIGHSVANEIKKLKLKKGEIFINIANEKAFKLKKRFVDQDLNRSFPGKKDGNHEQRLAAHFLPIIKLFDLVIDIHSTTSDLKDAVIVTKLNKKTKDIIEAIGPKYLLYMKLSKDNAFISSAKIGIAFEYGKDKDTKAINKTIVGVKRILSYFDMIDEKYRSKKVKTKYFKISKIVQKEKGEELLKGVKNYKLIKKGKPYSVLKDNLVYAKQDFYPILFGEKKYDTYFGFMGRLLG